MKKYILRVVIDSDINVNYSKGGESDVGRSTFILKSIFLKWVCGVLDVWVIAPHIANVESFSHLLSQASV